MDIWKMLGISETQDKDELKKAYRAKLYSVNPEDDAEGFMKLREAYEAALAFADSDAKEQPAEELEGIAAKIDALYKDFDSRINEDCWKELFDSDEFVALDTSEESFEELLVYLMRNYHIPSRIYKLIKDTFDLQNRKKELSEKFPEEFLDYIINNANYDDLIDYYKLDGDSSQFDKYIECYYKLDAAFRHGEKKSVIDEYLEELDNMDVEHPYYEILKIRLKLMEYTANEEVIDLDAEMKENNREDGEFEPKVNMPDEDEKMALYDLQGDARMLYQDFPEDITIINCIADIAMIIGDYDEAEELYEKALTIDKDNYFTKGKKAELLYRKKEFVASRDLFMDLLKENHYDNRVRAGVIRANQGIIADNRRKLREIPDDVKAKLEIAWSCYQSYLFEQGIEILDSFEPEEKDACEYYNVKGRTYLCISDYEKALGSFLIWKRCIENLKKDEEAIDEEELKSLHDRRKRLPYVHFLIADCYLKTKKYDEARAYLELPLSVDHDEYMLTLEANCELQFKTGKYEQCIDACEKLLDKDDRSYLGFYYKAKSCLKLDYLNDCLKACERAIAIFPYSVEAYVVEIQLYHKVGQFENAHAIIDRYGSIIEESDSMKFYRGLTYNYEDKTDAAIEILAKLVENIDIDKTDMEKPMDCFDLLGDLYDRIGKDDLAIETYQKMLKADPDNEVVHGLLGYMYKKVGRYEEALYEFDKQIQVKKGALYYINRGILNKYFGNYKKAISDFEASLALEPENAFCHSRIGMIYQMHRKFTEALKHFEKALYLLGDNHNTLELEVMRWKIKSLLCMGKFQEAHEVSTKLVMLHAEDDIYVKMEHADILVRMNQFNKAEKMYLNMISSETRGDIKVIYAEHLLEHYADECDVFNARRIFDTVVQNIPNNHRIYASMARVFREAGEYKNAVEFFQKAIEFDTEKEDNYYSELLEVLLAKPSLFRFGKSEIIEKANIPLDEHSHIRDVIKMARLNRLNKQYQKALELIERALGMRRCDTCDYGMCEEALYEKGLILEMMGRINEALSCFREALGQNGHNARYERKIANILSKRKY